MHTILLRVSELPVVGRVKRALLRRGCPDRTSQVERMVAGAKKYAAADEEMRRKAEAKRELEDAIFDVLDDEDTSTAARERAQEAEEWLSSKFDSLSVHDIQRKTLNLRRA